MTPSLKTRPTLARKSNSYAREPPDGRTGEHDNDRVFELIAEARKRSWEQRQLT